MRQIWRWALGMVAVSTVLSAGCAQDVGDIDRTQPNRLEKSVFEGDQEWYFRQTVVDTDFQGSLGMFNALESATKRVRWVITEDTLYAMSTVEPAEGLTDGFQDEETRRVGVVAAFPIQGHFDVQRSYNASTGEQSNVISENASDRNWYERKYMRVDWSRNLADGMQMFQNEIGSMAAASIGIPQEDGYIDPNRTRISENYIDTVTAYHYEPDLYACFYAFGLDSIYNCEGGQVKVRNSFLKRDAVEKYQPLEYLDTAYITEDSGRRIYSTNLYDPNLGILIDMECDQNVLNFERDENGQSAVDNCSPATFDMFSRFGYFRTERVTWDDDFGSNYESSRRYYANRWNIWETMLGEDGKVLDMQKRDPKPIIFHLNVEYPQDFEPEAWEVGRQWSEAFKESVAIAKGISKADVEADLQARYGSPEMFRIVHNSCSGPELAKFQSENPGVSKGLFGELGDNIDQAFRALSHEKKHLFCARLEVETEGTENAWEYQRVGDLRHSFFNWVEQDVPWLGYGPSANDPITGELISGNANFNGAAIRTYGPLAADYIQYMNGELDDNTVAMGEHTREELKRRSEATQRQGLNEEGSLELATRAGALSTYTPGETLDMNNLPKFIKNNSRQAIEQDIRRAVEHMELSKSSDTRAAEFFAKPEVRQFMMSDMNLKYMVESKAALDFGPEFTDDDVRTAYLNIAAPRQSFDRYQRRNAHMAQRNIFSLEYMDDMISQLVTYTGVADHFKGKSRDIIGDFFVKQMFVGTQLHEVGHTVGLRHNFIASTDVMNYHDTYWEIQRAIAKGLVSSDERWSIPTDKIDLVGVDVSRLGDKGVDIGYLSEAEFRIASVMDYTADFTGRFAGLGKYDQAAINFAYAEAVEVWAPDVQLNELLTYELWFSDYREIPRIMGGGQTGLGTPAEQELGIDTITQKRTYKPISVALSEMRDGLKSNLNNWNNRQFGPALRPWQERAVPYAFCSDEFNGSSLGCTVFDYGANQREIVNHQFDNYRQFQSFRRYHRGRINKAYENINGYANWVYSIFQMGNNPFRYYSYYQWYNLGAYTDDLKNAAIDTLNFFGEVMAMPEPNRYCLYNPTTTTNISPFWYGDLTNVYVPASYDNADGRCSNFIDVERGHGQRYNYDFTNEYDYRITRVGTFVDKTLASQAMFDISANFAQSDFLTDFRATNISYWTLFQDEIYNFLRGVLIDDYSAYSGVFNPVTGSYEPPQIVDKKVFGTGLPSEQANMRRVYTNISMTHRFNILVGAMIYNNGWYDRHADFGNYAKLCVSNIECQDLGPDAQLAEFIHPVTNQVYRAPIMANGKSLSAELVNRANVLKARYVQAQAALDAATPGSAQYAGLRNTVIFRSEQMEEIVARMDMVRYVWQALGASALR